jgi:hypothetical protein
MSYGHAERNLAALRMLEAETAELLRGLPQADPEQLRWLRETAARHLASGQPADRTPAHGPGTARR